MELTTGSDAPEFTLKNTEGIDVSLSEMRKNQPVVLFFFPLAFSDESTRELCMIRDNMKLYKSLNAHVIGISVDSYFALRAFKRSENLNFQLLSDFNKQISKRYNVLSCKYFDMDGVSGWAVFVIDQEGIIRHLQVLDHTNDSPEIKQVIKTLRSIKS